MSEAENSSGASDQDSISMSESGEMDIDYLQILSRSFSDLYLEVGGTVCPGFDIGWVSSIRICLYHRDILVGEMTCLGKTLVPDVDNHVITEWDEENEPEMPIKSMVAFRNFFADVMPRTDADNELDARKRAVAALKVSPSGHCLTMSIDLANMPRMNATVESLKVCGDEIEITMIITNPSPFRLHFELSSDFVLKQGSQTIGILCSDDFCISPGEIICTFKGDLQTRARGMATLKGIRSSEIDESWQQHVVKLFEVEINLDEMVTKRNKKGK